MTRDSDWYSLIVDDTNVGYAVISKDKILAEFYTLPSIGVESKSIFAEVINELGVKSIYCQSYDSQVMLLTLAMNFDSMVVGYIYRDLVDTMIHPTRELSFRYADTSDLPFLSLQDDEVFEPKDLLEELIKSKGIIIANITSEIVGCGFLTRVSLHFDNYDIGVWVNPKNRMQGLATEIMLQLKDICIENNWTPLAACGADNIASQKILSKIGFTTLHQLIEYTVP
jgi:hypothetical protein